ncbi:MAG: hypothetical protein JSV16_09915, partial [Candidatus Hydrogenedentota bacterium]
LLDEIKRVEDESAKLIARAGQDSEQRIRSAHEEARGLIERMKEECRRIESQTVAEAESEARKRAQAAGKENQKAIDSLRVSAQANMERAVKLIIDSIAGSPEWP